MFINLAAATPPVDPLSAMSVWDFAVKGGPTILVIVLVSLLALAVTVERLVITRRSAVTPPEFLATIKPLAADPARALEACRANGSPIANILAAAIRHRRDPIDILHKSIGEAGKRELVRLRHRMRLMSALPQIATMLGLLGTILGMIKTFQAVASSGQSLGKTELLARGIFEAWACTAAGLLVAIPVLILYHVILGRIDARTAELDKIATEWLDAQSEPFPRAAGSEPASGNLVPA